jgi:GDPmannose 4,6-dehydratase
MGKKALIIGSSGQDGTYLADFLHKKGYEVAGVSRTRNKASPPHIKTVRIDISTGLGKLFSFMDEFGPDEIYNLAGIHSYQKTLSDSSSLFLVNSVAPISVMHHLLARGSKARFFQSSSSYMYSGKDAVIDEKTLPNPTSPYGISKLAAHSMARHFRSQGLYACSGILFNHESPLRTEEFVTKKISRAAAQFCLKKREGFLPLGSLDATRDWGFAGDYVEAMWLMLQQKEPDDYVIATGEQRSVREFCQEAFSCVGLGYGKFIKSAPSLVRKDETTFVANPKKAKQKLGWRASMGFKGLVRLMVDAEIKDLEEMP